jgi:septal ring factor EnvC (AmiA/AmiB activator)
MLNRSSEADELARELDEANREKRLLSDELHRVKRSLAKQQRDRQSTSSSPNSVRSASQTGDEVARLNAELLDLHRRFAETTAQHEREVASLRRKLSRSITLRDLRTEMNALLPEPTIPEADSVKTLLHSFHAAASQSDTDYLREQLRSDRTLVGQLAHKFTSRTASSRDLDSSRFVRDTIDFLDRLMTGLFSNLGTEFSRFHRGQPPPQTLEELMDAFKAEAEELNWFAEQLRDVLEVEDANLGLRELFDLLRDHLAAVTKGSQGDLQLADLSSGVSDEAHSHVLRKLDRAKKRYERAQAELDQLSAQLAEKEKMTEDLKAMVEDQRKEIASLIDRGGASDSVRKDYEQRFGGLQATNEFVAQVTAKVKEFHKFVIGRFERSAVYNPLVLEVLRNAKPVFQAFSLPVFMVDFLRQPALVTMTYRIVSIRPDVESELFGAEHKQILRDISRELSSFPLSRHRQFPVTATEPLETRLQQVLRSVRLVRDLFKEKEESFNQLSSIIKTQHTTILDISHSPMHSGPE